MEHPILKRRQVPSIYVFKERIWSSLKNAPLYLEFIAILGKQQLQEGHSLENAPDGKRDRWKTKMETEKRIKNLESATILLIQETKMNASNSRNLMCRLWLKGEGIAISAGGIQMWW